MNAVEIVSGQRNVGCETIGSGAPAVIRIGDNEAAIDGAHAWAAIDRALDVEGRRRGDDAADRIVNRIVEIRGVAECAGPDDYHRARIKPGEFEIGDIWNVAGDGEVSGEAAIIVVDGCHEVISCCRSWRSGVHV